MSYTIADGQLAESRVAEFNSRMPWLSREVPAAQLAVDFVKFPSEDGAGFPFSGDHLGTYAHREILWAGEQGDEIARERVHTADVNVWAAVAADPLTLEEQHRLEDAEQAELEESDWRMDGII